MLRKIMQFDIDSFSLPTLGMSMGIYGAHFTTSFRTESKMVCGVVVELQIDVNLFTKSI